MTTEIGLSRSIRRLTLIGAAIITLVGATPARAQEDISAKLQRIEALLDDQSSRLNTQERKLAEQAALIQQQDMELRALRATRDEALAEIRAGRAAAPQQAGGLSPPLGPAPMTTASAQTPSGPVGEAPPPTTTEQKAREVAAIPERLGVLTPPGRFVFDPTVEYVRASTNRLTFRGVEIVPGINLGLIEAGDADRDSVVGTLAARVQRAVLLGAAELIGGDLGIWDRLLENIGLDPWRPESMIRANAAPSTDMRTATRERLEAVFAQENADLAAYLGYTQSWCL